MMHPVRAFDKDIIDKNLEETKGIIYWRNERLQKVIFMTDIILSGSSTIKMLDHYLYKKDEKRGKSRFLCLPFSLEEILGKNKNLAIEIHSIFGAEGMKEYIEQKYTEFDVKVIVHNEISKEFIATEETFLLVNEVYGILSPSSHDNASREKIWCVIRSNNLPYKNILPDDVCDSKKLAGLFRRHCEASWKYPSIDIKFNKALKVSTNGAWSGYGK